MFVRIVIIELKMMMSFRLALITLKIVVRMRIVGAGMMMSLMQIESVTFICYPTVFITYPIAGKRCCAHLLYLNSYLRR